MGRLVFAVIVIVVLLAVIAWCAVELRPGASRRDRERAEQRERREEEAAARYPVGTVVRCATCGETAAEIREEPFVSERRGEVRALVACSACGTVTRQPLTGAGSRR